MQDHLEQIKNVTRYVREHINEPLNRETLAEVAGFSVPHFHRIFIASTGESAVSYVRRMRLERAGRKLRMGAVDITPFRFSRFAEGMLPEGEYGYGNIWK